MKLNICHLLLTFGLFYSGNSQNQQEVDSLLTIYEKSNVIKERMYALDELIDIFIYTEPNKAKEYIDDMIEMSEKANYKHGILRGEFCLGHYYSTLGQMDLGANYYRKALKRSYKNNDDAFIATILKNLAIYEEHKGNYNVAIVLLDSSATYQKSYGNYERFGSAMNFIGYNYFQMGNYPKAMEFYQKALRTLDTIDIRTYYKADTHRNIGYLERELKNLDSAISEFQKAMKVYEETDDHLYQAQSLLDIGNIYLMKKENGDAINFFNKALKMGKEYNFPTVIDGSFSSLGVAFLNEQNFSKSIFYLKKGIQEVQSDISEKNKIINEYNLGRAYSLNGESDIALFHLNNAVQSADSLKIYSELEIALNYRANHFENNGFLLNAIRDLKKSEIVRDSILSIEKIKQIEKLQAIYETEKKEAEIALQEEEINTLNAKSRADNLQKGIFAGGMISALALSGLLIFGFRQRIKKNRIAREKQEEIYRQEIAHKKKELTSQTLHLVQKNTFIQELKDNLENIKKSPEKFKTEFRRIVMLLKKENASDKDWEVFKSYFSEVHNDFDQKLKTLYADISEKEIRLAAFLRMNLTTKEIAATLNVLPDSILKSKYRLKKKLGLDKETDLTSFLNTL